MAWVGITGHGALAVAAVAAPAPAPVAVVHVADLPAAVRAKLPHPMADPGAPWQASDVVVTEGLPFARLIRASHDGTTWTVDYERGGRGHSATRATFEQVGSVYTVRHQRMPSPRS